MSNPAAATGTVVRRGPGVMVGAVVLDSAEVQKVKRVL